MSDDTGGRAGKTLIDLLLCNTVMVGYYPRYTCTLCWFCPTQPTPTAAAWVAWAHGYWIVRPSKSLRMCDIRMTPRPNRHPAYPAMATLLPPTRVSHIGSLSKVESQSKHAMSVAQRAIRPTGRSANTSGKVRVNVGSNTMAPIAGRASSDQQAPMR